MKVILIFLLLFPLLRLNAQHQVIDSITNIGVSYTHIKVSNKPIGVLTDYNGVFNLDSTFNLSDTIIISCIGYNSKKVQKQQIINNKTIILSPSCHKLEEVEIKDEKIKYYSRNLGITKQPHKRGKVSLFVGAGKNGKEKAIYIPNKYSVSGNLKSVNVYITKLGYPNAHFRIHVYECNPINSKPGKELTKSNIIASGTTGDEWVTIDMSKEYIKINENGCYIGIEWFDSPDSKYFQDILTIRSITYNNNKRQDSIYIVEKDGDGAVIGVVLLNDKESQGNLCYKWQNEWLLGVMPYSSSPTYDTLDNGRLKLLEPRKSLLCVNIDVDYPKGKINMDFEPPKKSKLNRFEKVKLDVYKYPQANITDLFNSIIKAIESDDIVYMLQYLCVYKDDQLNEILQELNTNSTNNYLDEDEKQNVLKEVKSIMDKIESGEYELQNVGINHFKLVIGQKSYNLTITNRGWAINPYTYKIIK